MYALITGASGGIGKEMSLLLAEKGYDLIIVARRIEKLEELKKEIEKNFNRNVIVIKADLSQSESAYKLYEEIKDLDINIVINNAGFGKIGDFTTIPLQDEIEMINTNITSLHILTKLFAIKMQSGHILNVASMAGYQPDPHMSTYGATKSYVLSLGQAVNYELKKLGKNVKVQTLCPGPVSTGFNDVAGGDFTIKAMTAKKCAKIAINEIFKGKAVIITGFKMKAVHFFTKLLPMKIILPIEYKIQKSKE